MENVHIFSAIFMFVALAVSQKDCEPGWVNRGGKSCYLLSDDHYRNSRGPNFYSANAFCKYKNSHLAVITSEEENDFIKAWLRQEIKDETEGVWIDGEDFVGRGYWEWSSLDEKIDFSDFARVFSGKRSGGCISMSPQFNFSWIGKKCWKEEHMEYICEKDICQVPTQCFQESCYSLYCSIRSPRMYRFVLDLRAGKPSVCPKGSLARIDSEEENDFIRRFLAQSGDFLKFVWTGGYDENSDGNWKWADSEEPITGFTNWTSKVDSNSSPSVGETCLALSRDNNWEWTSLDCQNLYPILCEEPFNSG